MAVTIFNGLRKVFAGLLGTHNDDDGTESGDNFHVGNQLDAALRERSQSFNLSPDTNALVNTTLRHVFEARWPIELKEVNYVSDGTLTVNATNYAKITLYKGNGAAAAATVAASINTAAGSNMAAGVALAATLSSTAANLKLATGETLAVEIKKYGAGGVAVPAGALVVHYHLQ